MENRGIYEDAILKWGHDLQFGMVYEEMAELIIAINKYRRGTGTKAQIIEEVADVMIMIEELMVLVGIDEKSVFKAKVNKINKLKKQLDGDKDEG